MTKTALLICGICFVVVSAHAQFEGVIDMKMVMNEEGVSREMMYSMSVKKDMMAAAVKGNDETMNRGRFIFRGDKKMLWIVNDDQKNYLEISLADKEQPEKTGETK